jgi:hypothetical protein
LEEIIKIFLEPSSGKGTSDNKCKIIIGGPIALFFAEVF